MREFALAARDLCFLRLAPQDLPYSQTLLIALVAARLALDLAMGLIIASVGAALFASILGTALTLVAVWGLLRMTGYQARFVQTATALTLASLVFGLLSIPLKFGLHPLPDNAEQVVGAQLGMLLLLAILGGWSLAVTGHVLRHALDRSFLQGIGYALVISFAIVLVLRALMSVP